MKSLSSYIQESIKECIKEGILDSEETITDRIISQPIVDRLLNKQKLRRNEIDTLEKAVAVWKPKDKNELKNLIVRYIKQAGDRCSLNWIDVSDIENMSLIFFCSYFNGDISKWDVSKVEDMSSMFSGSNFNGDISKWDVSNVENMSGMFYSSKFNSDISKWKINHECKHVNMFYGCPIKEQYKPKIK